RGGHPKARALRIGCPGVAYESCWRLCPRRHWQALFIACKDLLGHGDVLENERIGAAMSARLKSVFLFAATASLVAGAAMAAAPAGPPPARPAPGKPAASLPGPGENKANPDSPEAQQAPVT